MLYFVPDGMTLHSAFNFSFGNSHVPLPTQKLAQYRNNLQNLEMVIIDEISMINSDFLYKIHRRLCEIFQSDDVFANKSIILVGDLLQLPPVQNGSKLIFEPPENSQFNAYHQAHELWQQFEVYNLEHNHRQGEGNSWANVLNEIREGTVTKDTEELLKTRFIKPEEHDELTTCHCFFRNVDVSEHNTKMLNSLSNDHDLVELPAIETLPKGFISPVMPHGTIGLRGNDTGFMKILYLRKQARVMMISNINTPDELVNGAMGTVADFIANDKGVVECLIVIFDSESCGEDQRNRYSEISAKYKDVNGTPIFRKEHEYDTGRRRKGHTCKAKLYQFPFRLAWAVTAHKMQVRFFLNEYYNIYFNAFLF